jgi:MFS family permease
MLVYLLRGIMDLTVLAQVNAMGGSLRWLSVMAFLQASAGFGFGMTAGWLIRRTRQRQRLLVVGCLGAAVALGAASIAGNLAAFVFLIGLAAGCTTFVQAAEAIVERTLLPDDDAVIIANSVRGTVMHTLKIMTPLATGVVLASTIPVVILGGLAAAMAIPMLVFATVGGQRPGDADPDGDDRVDGLLRAFKRSAADIAARRDLTLFFAVEIVTVLLLGMQGPLIFTFIVDERGYAADDFPYLMAALGAGAVVGSLALPLISRGRRPSLALILVLLVVDGFALLGFVFASAWIELLAFMAAMGLLGGLFAVIMRTFLQTIREENLRERMIGVYYALFDPLAMTGLLVVFIVAPFAASQHVLIAAGVGEIVVGLIGLAICSAGGVGRESEA